MRVKGRGFKNSPEYIGDLYFDGDEYILRVDDLNNLDFWLEITIPVEDIIRITQERILEEIEEDASPI